MGALGKGEVSRSEISQLGSRNRVGKSSKQKNIAGLIFRRVSLESDREKIKTETNHFAEGKRRAKDCPI